MNKAKRSEPKEEERKGDTFAELRSYSGENDHKFKTKVGSVP